MKYFVDFFKVATCYFAANRVIKKNKKKFIIFTL